MGLERPTKGVLHEGPLPCPPACTALGAPSTGTMRPSESDFSPSDGVLMPDAGPFPARFESSRTEIDVSFAQVWESTGPAGGA